MPRGTHAGTWAAEVEARDARIAAAEHLAADERERDRLEVEVAALSEQVRPPTRA